MPQPRPSWPRRLRRVCLFPLLGLVTNLGTAVVFAQPFWFHLARWSLVEGDYHRFERGAVRTEWFTYSWLGHSRTEVSAESAAQQPWDKSKPAELPSSAAWRRLDLSPGESAIIWAVGWPLRTLTHGDVAQSDRSLVVWGAWRFKGTDERRFPPRHFEVVVPFAPLWPGLAFNTLFYALLWWLAFASVRMVKHNRRYRHGLCPLCRYDLRADYSQGCSECGWGR